MPSGGAILCAAAVLLLSGFGRRVAASLGVRPPVLAVWCLLAAAASILNLRLPGARGWVPLVNPGGLLVPVAFEAFLFFGPARRGRSIRSDGWALLAGAVGGLTLAGAVAWDGSTGLMWPAYGFALLVGAALGPTRAGSARSAVMAGAAAVACGALAQTGLALVGWSAWPVSVGGGPVFDAGVWALVAAGTLYWPARLGRYVRPALRPVREAIPQRR